MNSDSMDRYPSLYRWRVGRRVGRTIYIDDGDPDPNDGSNLIGVMDMPEMAAHVVGLHNWWWEKRNVKEDADGAA